MYLVVYNRKLEERESKDVAWSVVTTDLKTDYHFTKFDRLTESDAREMAAALNAQEQFHQSN